MKGRGRRRWMGEGGGGVKEGVIGGMLPTAHKRRARSLVQQGDK